MKIGFDLDGTLDRPVLTELCKGLLAAGHEIHIISGVFPEAVGWQDSVAKKRKLARLAIPYDECIVGLPDVVMVSQHSAGVVNCAHLHILQAVPATFDRDYRLADLGLRKGALCEELGITLFFDDSRLYCEMIPKMSGGTLTLKVGSSE
jgi:hypothetical protein